MIHHSSSRGRTRLVAGLTPRDVPTRENDPINEGIVESPTHEVVQQALGNAPNIEQSIDEREGCRRFEEGL